MKNKRKRDTILVLTYKSLKHMLEMGGSATWKSNRKRARQMKYLLCTRNQHYKLHKPEGPEAHGDLGIDPEKLDWQSAQQQASEKELTFTINVPLEITIRIAQ